MLALEQGDVVHSVVGWPLYMLILESQAAEDPVCSRVLILDADECLTWKTGEVGLVARSALRNGNYEKFGG